MEEIERAGHEIQAYVQRTSAACGLICDMLSAYCLPDRGAAIFNAGFCYVTNRERSYKPCLCQAVLSGNLKMLTDANVTDVIVDEIELRKNGFDRTECTGNCSAEVNSLSYESEEYAENMDLEICNMDIDCGYLYEAHSAKNWVRLWSILFRIF
ncbi:Large ribosomal subunit protein [Trichinella pseudospiralis]